MTGKATVNIVINSDARLFQLRAISALILKAGRQEGHAICQKIAHE